jgi:hypothetical protein
MTKQQYYDLLVETSRSGGFPSVGVHDKCVYRGDNGRKCAVGLLIPDDEYSERWDKDECTGLTCGEECPRGLLACVKRHIPEGMKLEDLEDCQSAHDMNTDLNKPWNHAGFVKLLNGKDFFSDVVKQEGSPCSP